MAMTTATIVNAMKENYQGTPSDDQIAAMERLAQAVIDTVKQMAFSYIAGLNAPNGPVTGDIQYSIE